MPSSTLDWPPELPRTPSRERESINKFRTGFRKTRSQLGDELERVGADDWRLSHVKGSDGDPGVVVRWSMDGGQYAVACDQYTQKGDNLRAVYLYIKEKRKMQGRPVTTGQSEFATARLPPGDAADAVAPEPAEPSMDAEQAADLLGIDPDAPDRLVRVAYQEAMKDEHPDQGGSGGVDRLQEARDVLLEGAHAE